MTSTLTKYVENSSSFNRHFPFTVRNESKQQICIVFETFTYTKIRLVGMYIVLNVVITPKWSRTTIAILMDGRSEVLCLICSFTVMTMNRVSGRAGGPKRCYQGNQTHNPVCGPTGENSL